MKFKKKKHSIYFFLSPVSDLDFEIFLIMVKYLQCSLNILTLQFCRCDVSAFPTSVLNLATFMYKHLLGAGLENFSDANRSEF